MQRTTTAGLRGILLLLAGALIAPESRGDGAEDRPASLARYFPGEDLVVYAEFDGLDAHGDAWTPTAAARLLAETPTGGMLRDLLAQALEQTLPPTGRDGRPSGAEVAALAEHAVRQGFAFGIVRPAGQPRPSLVGLVVRGAAAGAVREPVARLIDGAVPRGRRPEAVTRPGGRRVLIVGGQGPAGMGFAWWSEGADLALSLVRPEGADLMIEALEGRRPDASGHPTRAALARAEGGFEPIGWAFFDMAALPALPPQAASLGLDRLRRLDYRWGVRGEALMTVTRLVAPAPRAGVLALLDAPGMAVTDLPPLPANLDGVMAFTVAPGAFYDRVRSLAGVLDPRGGAQLDALAEAVRQATGHRLREDLLGHLGPRAVAYVVPEEVHAPITALGGFARGLVHVPRAVLMVELDDPDAFAGVLDDLVKRANAAFRGGRRGDGGDDEPAAEFRPVEGPPRGYTLAVPPGVLPLPAGLRPTVLVGQTYLALATTPQAARDALAREGQPGGLPESLAKAAEGLPGRVTFLAVHDPRRGLLPEVIANLPALAQVIGSGEVNPFRTIGLPFGPRRFRPPSPGRSNFRLRIAADQVPDPDDLRRFLFPAGAALTVDDDGLSLVTREAIPSLNPVTLAPIALALALPAVTASRTAAQRAQSTNNLKQIGLALHNYHSTNDHFPPVALRGKDGTPLLSWRVAILPFLEQNGLFQEFHLDEPWDSPHNKALLERMPTTYAVPGSDAAPGMTFYRAFAGKGTLFDPTVKDGVSIRDVTDGTSNTLAVVEAREAVPWTKPDAELPFDPEAIRKPAAEKTLLPLLGGHFPGGFDALLTDGSVRFIKESINVVILRALITRAGGEVVSRDAF